MKKYMTAIFLVTLAGCATGQTPIPEPDSPVAKTYSEKCGACHSLPHPKRHTFEQWEHMIAVMDKQMEHRGMAQLTPDEKSGILTYLKKHSR